MHRLSVVVSQYTKWDMEFKCLVAMELLADAEFGKVADLLDLQWRYLIHLVEPI